MSESVNQSNCFVWNSFTQKVATGIAFTAGIITITAIFLMIFQNPGVVQSALFITGMGVLALDLLYVGIAKKEKNEEVEELKKVLKKEPEKITFSDIRIATGAMFTNNHEKLKPVTDKIFRNWDNAKETLKQEWTKEELVVALGISEFLLKQLIKKIEVEVPINDKISNALIEEIFVLIKEKYGIEPSHHLL